jgi:iron complex transport system ATP-binding protein
MTGALVIEGVSVGYAGRPVIDGLSVPPLQPGALTALIGPNAAGKTTLLRGLAGLVRTTGSVRHGGTELTRLAPAEHARFVAYMPQTLPQRVALSVYEATLAALRASPAFEQDRQQAARRAMEALDRLGIAGLATRPLDRLSGGQRQLASLAQCIVRRPPVLLLDEPTSALDLAHQFRVMQVVSDLAREQGMVAVVVLHDIALAARWCERVVVLDSGRVAADGAPLDAITPATLASVWGVAARIERCARGTLQVIIDGPIESAAASHHMAERNLSEATA